MKDCFTIPISDCKKLLVELYVIGYSECGESIVMLFVDGSNKAVLYSVVIDSYQLSDGTFKTDEILVNRGVSHIDVLCWSHPDTDHTKGIVGLVEKYCDKSSIIIIPDFMYGLNDDPIDYNENDAQIIQQLFLLNNRLQKAVRPTGANSNCTGDAFSVCFSDEVNEIMVDFIAIAPHKDYLVENKREGIKIHKNYLSICLLINVGPYKFVFTGDLEERTINHIVKYPFEFPLFLKIPHHCSINAGNLFDILQLRKSSMSCTTTYNSKGLPNKAMLDTYRQKCTYVHSTGYHPDKPDGFGIVEYNCNLFDKHEIHIKCHGHAQKIV